MSVYLDYNATTPIDPRVLDVMVDVYKNDFGNADSRTHDFGENARRIVENARKQVAALLKVDPSEVFFTSGATEGSNTVIQGLKEYGLRTGKTHIVTSSIEHKAVLETCKAMEKDGFKVDYINPCLDGRINTQDVLSKVTGETLLVAIMHVNNETGIIQPVEEIGNSLENRDTFFFVDATQSCGKLVEELQDLEYDMLVFSSHKLRGPQGSGVMILKKRNYKRVPVKPILYGGQQEHGFSPGTIPVALVAGTGEACRIAEEEYKQNTVSNKKIKESILALFENSGISFHYNGKQLYCVDNTVNICLENIRSEALMIASKQYCGISNGSACTSKSYDPSYVLKAMGVTDHDAECSIRLSWGAGCKAEDIIEGVDGLIHIAKTLV